MELAPQDEDLRDVLNKFMGRISKAFSIGLESAQKRGDVRKDLDVRESADLLTSTLFGIAVLGRSGFSRETLYSVVDNTLTLFRP